MGKKEGKKKGSKSKESVVLGNDSRFVMDDTFVEKKEEKKEEEEEEDMEFVEEEDEDKILSMKSLQKYNEKKDQRGVIYISRIPPYMKLVKLRQLLSQHGKIDRIYLTPADPKTKTKKLNSTSRTKFQDGWVEFLDKKVAKNVALMLNMTQVGGSRKSLNYHDVWNMKYLSGFKWHHLTEKMKYDRAVREQKLRAEMRQMKKESAMYLGKVQKAKIDEKKRNKEQKRRERDGEEEEEGGRGEGREDDDFVEKFPQHKVVAKQPKMMSQNFLGAAFGQD